MDYCVDLAKKSHASVVLLHAYYLPAPSYDISFPSVWFYTDEAEKKLQRELAILSAKIRNHKYDADLKSIQIETITKYGTPEAEILIESKKKQVDLIVIGARQVHGLNKFLGSTTTEVISGAVVPVLIIPAHSQFRDFRNLVYATDLTEEKEDFSAVIEFAGLYNAPITFVHVARSHHNQEVKKDFGAFRREITTRYQDRKFSFEVIHEEDIVQSLETYIKNKKADCLVLKHHHYSFFKALFHKSVINKIVFDAPMPLLVLP
jgi:nucleotide-binding universal stress UspA family protein